MRGPVLQPLPGMPPRAASGIDRIPAAAWAALLGDAAAVRRYRELTWPAAGHLWWTGALDSSGHGSLTAHGRQFSAHAFGYQLAHGLVLPAAGILPVIRHSCDNASCQDPAHLAPGSAADNAADYSARRWRADSPLADSRGARGRAVAVRAAIAAMRRSGLAADAAVAAALCAGQPRQLILPGMAPGPGTANVFAQR
jgi:hypothetical protein